MLLNSEKPAREQIGSVIRQYRKGLGLTQEQLAEAATLSVGLVRDLEQGRTHSPRWGSVEALALALGLNGDTRTQLTRSCPPDYRRQPTVRHHTADPITIRILGPLTVERAGVVTDLGPMRRRAVLAMLVLGGDAGARMSEILDLLWPVNAPTTAKNVIQGYITSLRQLLSGEPPCRGRNQPIVWNGVRYQFRHRPNFHVDSLEFAQRVGTGDKAVASGQLVQACHVYERALDMWRGPVVGDLDCLQEHPSVIDLNRLRSEVIARYADAAGLAGDHARALPRLRQACQAEPLNELLHARLIAALSASGRRTEAVLSFKQLQERLDVELGIAPPEPVWRAYAAVLEAERRPSRDLRIH